MKWPHARIGNCSYTILLAATQEGPAYQWRIDPVPLARRRPGGGRELRGGGQRCGRSRPRRAPLVALRASAGCPAAAARSRGAGVTAEVTRPTAAKIAGLQPADSHGLGVTGHPSTATVAAAAMNTGRSEPVADWCHVPDAARLGPRYRGS